MLRIENISYLVEGRPLIENASAVIPAGHKVGLVGRNGTGKTTLFRLIRGELALETGEIRLPRGARIGGVAQEVPGNEISLLDTVLAADVERATLMTRAARETDGARIAEIQTRLADIDAWSAEARAATILKGLGFTDAEQAMPCSAFSGGWRMRVALAGVLFARPDLLLLDEPTNYLDLEGALWLESYLARYPHSVIIISHDRDLLNRAVGGILHLEDRKLTFYQGNYDTFANTRAARLASAEAENKRLEAQRAHLQSFVDRFRYKASKAVQAQSRLKMIARLKPIATPEEVALKRFTFPVPEELSPPIINTEGLSAGYDGRVVLGGMNLRIDQDDRIALLGRNGQGKSTLAKVLAGRLAPMSGRMTRSNRLRVGFFAQHQIEDLRPEETPIEHLRRLRPGENPGQIRSRLGNFGIGAVQADTLVARLSGGQRARLSLLLATLDAPHILILDEPTNHLDMESREALVDALNTYTGAVILVSHDMHLLSLVADRLWLIGGGKVANFEGDLEAYRALLLEREGAGTDSARDGTGAAAAAARPAPVSRDAMLNLRAEVRKCEERIAKLTAMRDKLARKLADPALYEKERIGEAEVWQRKYAEVMEGLDRAETLWVDAQERLEKVRA